MHCVKTNEVQILKNKDTSLVPKLGFWLFCHTAGVVNNSAAVAVGDNTERPTSFTPLDHRFRWDAVGVPLLPNVISSLVKIVNHNESHLQPRR